MEKINLYRVRGNNSEHGGFMFSRRTLLLRMASTAALCSSTTTSVAQSNGFDCRELEKFIQTVKKEYQGVDRWASGEGRKIFRTIDKYAGILKDEIQKSEKETSILKNHRLWDAANIVVAATFMSIGIASVGVSTISASTLLPVGLILYGTVSTVALIIGRFVSTSSGEGVMQSIAEDTFSKYLNLTNIAVVSKNIKNITAYGGVAMNIVQVILNIINLNKRTNDISDIEKRIKVLNGELSRMKSHTNDLKKSRTKRKNLRVDVLKSITTSISSISNCKYIEGQLP